MLSKLCKEYQLGNAPTSMFIKSLNIDLAETRSFQNAVPRSDRESEWAWCVRVVSGLRRQMTRRGPYSILHSTIAHHGEFASAQGRIDQSREHEAAGVAAQASYRVPAKKANPGRGLGAERSRRHACRKRTAAAVSQGIRRVTGRQRQTRRLTNSEPVERDDVPGRSDIHTRQRASARSDRSAVSATGNPRIGGDRAEGRLELVLGRRGWPKWGGARRKQAGAPRDP